jgi:aminoglycoside phosphotransferase family enzyme
VPIGLAEKVAFLTSLCGPGDEVIETHFAWVFLVGQRALKLRKPVRRDSMDYSSIAARRADSEAELRLNRRLAPGIYLRMRPLRVDEQHQLSLGPQGEIVDWLVEMRRLDRHSMLDAVLERHAATEADLDRVAALLASFYASAPPAVTEPGAEGGRLHAQIAANHAVLAQLDPGRADRLLERQQDLIRRLDAMLDERARRGCIVEAHGDLRPEHILVTDPPAVIDCLEFNRELRILDRAEELCFLEIECARIGHPAIGRRLLEMCLDRLADDASPRLLDFYRSHRAATRAKLYTWRASEPDGGTPAEWWARATEYLDTALDAADAAAA